MCTMRASRASARRKSGSGDLGGGRAPHASRWVVALAVAGLGIATASAQPAAPSNLAGAWTLQESTGNLPDQAVRAVDGVTESGGPVAIRIEQTDASVTVRRLGSDATVLRVMVVAAPADAEAPRAGLPRLRAEWREGTLIARGDVTVKRGFLKRRVPFEERWQLDEAGSRLTVTMTLMTPLGARQRTQIFVRAPAEVAAGRPGLGLKDRTVSFVRGTRTSARPCSVGI